ncbi:hypothetical protein ACFY97_18550 [Streptomyces klenkii]|uniref:hypothetical protein n=1 Tax=Streptomyces klenkii TaxID=1420899 RepID=UPI0036EF6C0E
MNDGEPQPLSTSLPIYTATDGQPYMSCHHVAALLRAIAETCRNLDEAELVPDVLEDEANALACHAILHTRQA